MIVVIHRTCSECELNKIYEFRNYMWEEGKGRDPSHRLWVMCDSIHPGGLLLVDDTKPEDAGATYTQYRGLFMDWYTAKYGK